MIERYTLPEMREVWSEETKLKTWLEVELAIVKALAEEGRIPKTVARNIKKRARCSPRRVSQIEGVIKHDLLAFVEAVGENLGTSSRYFHMGVTSSDVVDTALALVLRRATGLVLQELEALRHVVGGLARRHRHTLVVGRTHGIHAEPTTLGLKFTVWYNDLGRALARIERAASEVEVGKVSGAVGNYSHLSPRTEEIALDSLGLKAERPATQVVQRDRHADYVACLAIAASAMERIALEVRHLQRTEVAEMEEPFERGQKGSSSMPHKRNPITLERICGLARLARSNAMAAIENVALWHERDISHSSVERVILPDTTILVHYMARNLKRVLAGLEIDAARMAENLELTGGRIYSQRLMLALAEAGWGRRQAYEKVQRLSTEAERAKRHLRDAALEDADIGSLLGRKAIAKIFDPQFYGRYTDQILRGAGVLPGASVGRKNRRKRG
ncbi:MAG TPA: adenylosuccinate lyase [bacterium]|nr:adenylosuccinate lyase [bacterium]